MKARTMLCVLVISENFHWMLIIGYMWKKETIDAIIMKTVMSKQIMKQIARAGCGTG